MHTLDGLQRGSRDTSGAPLSVASGCERIDGYLKRLRAKDGARVRIVATKYHIAESRAAEGEAPGASSGGRRGAAPNTSRKRVCFWEVGC